MSDNDDNGCPCSLLTITAPNGRLGNAESPKLGKLKLRERDGWNALGAISGAGVGDV
uniref:Uncharacterized protein n=1 Tax=Arundo donax TaxID=35708 RepID=A0A0A9B0F4_ARUDO